jgi:hypothetical protein
MAWSIRDRALIYKMMVDREEEAKANGGRFN